MEQFNFGTLTALLNQQIQLKDGSNNVVQLNVDKVSLPRFTTEEYEAFSVDLSSAAEVHCPGGNYLFSHQAFGEVQLFMSPYATDKYQIVVSRKRTSSAQGELCFAPEFAVLPFILGEQ